MDRVTVLSQSSHIDRSNIPISTVQSALSPAFTNILHIQRALSSVSVALILHAWLAARMALWVSRLCIIQAWLATLSVASLSTKVMSVVWTCDYMKKVRKRVERDLACFILGSGNSIFLMLFWPGWWVLGGTALAFARLYG